MVRDMKHRKGDCPNADPNSDEYCRVCALCKDKECVREKEHEGFCWSKDDIPVTPRWYECPCNYTSKIRH